MGAIYLPETARGSLGPQNIKQVKFDPKHYTNATIEKIIKDETGYAVKLGQPNMEVSRLKSIDEMRTRFAEVFPSIKKDRIVLSMK
jgi:hypothetical protein